MAFSVCAAPPLPCRLAADGLIVHLVGCAVWSSSEGGFRAELILTAELGRDRPTVFFQQSTLAAAQLQVRLQGDWRCDSPTVGLHALLVGCVTQASEPGPERPRTLHIRAKAEAQPKMVRLAERQATAEGGLMACTGRVVYGELAERLHIHANSLAAWSRGRRSTNRHPVRALSER